MVVKRRNVCMVCSTDHGVLECTSHSIGGGVVQWVVEGSPPPGGGQPDPIPPPDRTPSAPTDPNSHFPPAPFLSTFSSHVQTRTLQSTPHSQLFHSSFLKLCNQNGRYRW